MDLAQILKTAIEAEKAGLKNYLEFARQTKEETGKNMFIRLAMDELEHMDILEKQLERRWEKQPFGRVVVERSVIEKIVPVLSESAVRQAGRSTTGESLALATALEHEKKAREYYLTQAQEVQEAELKALFERLAEMEDNHYRLIEAELDYINRTGFWFGIPQFTMDGQ